ncbi:hypothetical protein IQ06DRAFT_309680 [Phaeosphaeriaceae sp. SRC1lsM3a]|nr:hypothetical protein IQ06DRAFT_309680 [Stagonospora sp. SRC1lsM3a]
MMFALVLLLSIAAIGQVFLVDVYKIVDIENGKVMPDATLPDTMRNGLRGFGAALTIALVGILAVKINFLLFFKRLGTQITTYLVFWYAVFFITISCGATNLGLMDYKCVFGDFQYIAMSCTQRNVLKRYFDFQIVSVVLDVVSDLFIMCFPIIILWNVRITLRKKLILSCTFGLVALTIAVTIVRGSVFGGTYKKFNANEMANLNPGWMWFWIFIEFAVAFLIACIISFRALFAQREQRSYENQVEQQRLAWEGRATESTSGKRSGIIKRARLYHDSLLQSFKSLETRHDMNLPNPETGRFSPTFLTEIQNNDLTTEKTTTSSKD